MAYPENRRTVLPTLIVSVLFGAAAGAVCTLVVIAYVAPRLEIGTPSVQVGGGAVQRREAEEVTAKTFEPAGRAAVMLALAKEEGTVLDRAYVPGDALAAGMVLTSDGWIVTVGDAVLAKAKDPKDLVAVIGVKAYPIERLTRDPYTGVSFMKIAAANLPVTAFGSSETVEAGHTVYARDPAGGLRRLPVLAFDLAPAASPRDLVRSSERLHRTIRLEGEGLMPGEMVLDRKGEVIAIVADAGPFGTHAVPVDAFSRVLGAVLRDKTPARPYLGASYIELSQYAGRDASLPARGALLSATADGKSPAVRPKGPADDAGLKAGDVVAALDGVQISAKNPLADAIADYEPGDTVTATVVRARTLKEEDVELVFGTAPVP